MTVLPANEADGTGSLPKSWPYANFAKCAGFISPGMAAVVTETDRIDGIRVPKRTRKKIEAT
jgi:hypothetical protein